MAPGVRDPFGIPRSVTTNTFLQQALTLRHLFTVTKGLRLTAGAQLQIEDGSSRGHLQAGEVDLPTGFDIARESWAPFVEAQLSPVPGLSIQGSLRLDLPEGFDPEVSPRPGASYTFAATDTTLRASWGEGFKLPSFFASGHPIVGNPGLVPVTSWSIDAGVTQTFWHKRLTLSAPYFYNELRHLIDFEEGPPPRLVNRDAVTTEGVEMSLHL